MARKGEPALGRQSQDRASQRSTRIRAGCSV